MSWVTEIWGRSLSDFSVFMRQLLRNPWQIRAVAPSGPAAAREMVRLVRPDMATVIEIGPGTGTFTRALLGRGLPPDALELYELNPDFCAHLRQQFPGVHVHNLPAQDMAKAAAHPADAVISGLPILSMPRAVQMAIVGAAFGRLRPGAPFVQFTYGPKPPLSRAVREAFGLTHEVGPRVWANLPPLRVYTFRQAQRPSPV